MKILVTGGSSGLGKAIVERLLQDENNRLCFTYNRHAEEATRLMNGCVRVEALKCDFANEAEVDSLMEQIVAFGPDVLINNAYAGNPQGKHFHKTDSVEFMESFRRNLIPAIRITQACIGIFRKKKSGKIINVLTDALLDLPPVGYAVYTANKAYLEQLSKSWNREYMKYNITSNCVSPGFMQTNLSMDVDERVVEQLKEAHPLHALLTPGEVADVIAALVYASQQVNGVNIPVNASQHVIK